MSKQAEITTNVSTILSTPWQARDGQVVPTTDTIALGNGAVKLDATYLYADLADSSGAAQRLKKEVTAKIFRCYLDAATRLIKHYGGEIRSFDGDRVMGIFVGSAKNSNAARAGLAINWSVLQVIKPKIEAKWNGIPENYTMGHGVGIDTGEALLVRGGVRGNNDIISIGEAPNVAAKLSGLRRGPDVYITDAVYQRLRDDIKTSSDGRVRWKRSAPLAVGGKSYGVMSSGWWWAP